MFTITLDRPPSKLQEELLRLFAYDLPEDYYLAVRNILAQYFLKKGQEEGAAFWERVEMKEDDVRKWLKKYPATKPAIEP